MREASTGLTSVMVHGMLVPANRRTTPGIHHRNSHRRSVRETVKQRYREPATRRAMGRTSPQSREQSRIQRRGLQGQHPPPLRRYTHRPHIKNHRGHKKLSMETEERNHPSAPTPLGRTQITDRRSPRLDTTDLARLETKPTEPTRATKPTRGDQAGPGRLGPRRRPGTNRRPTGRPHPNVSQTHNR